MLTLSMQTGWRQEDTAAIIDGRARKEAFCYLVRRHRSDLPDWRISETVLARDVHYRR